MNPILNRFFYATALLVIAGLLLHMSDFSFGYLVFIGGSIGFAIARVMAAINHHDRKRSRIPMIHFVSAISLLLAAYLMYKHSTSWPVFVLITAVLEIYATLRGSAGN